MFFISACLPMITVSSCCSGISKKAETTDLAASFVRSLPVMFVCPLILRNAMRSPRLALCWSTKTMDVKGGLW